MTEPAQALPPLPATDFVLAVNCGSSSVKFGAYATDGSATPWRGAFEGLEPGGQPVVRFGDGPPRPLPRAVGVAGFDAALDWLVMALTGGGRLRAVAHRIVHGGETFVAPVRLDAPVLDALMGLADLAPLHQPHNVAAARAFGAVLPHVPQVGCFDTAFHHALMPQERLLPLPQAVRALGLRRYGFHGLSYQWLVEQLRARGAAIDGRGLLFHLGNGSSACATAGGRSIATSMGFTALDGLMMGTRCGSLDPGVILHLWRAGWTLDQVERLLYRESGLLGVSGRSADMRVLRERSDDAARQAVALYLHRARREAGALLAVAGAPDVIAFTGGIGEHDAAVRAAICEALAVCGVRLDDAANLAADGTACRALHVPGSPVQVWVVPADEGSVAARAAMEVI